jgi:hypothetical protein
MNVFAVFERTDGGKCLLPSSSQLALTPLLFPCPAALNVVTPSLDGTILPGVTRGSVLSLLSYTPALEPDAPTEASNDQIPLPLWQQLRPAATKFALPTFLPRSLEAEEATR